MKEIKQMIKAGLIFCVRIKIIRVVGAKLFIFFPAVKRRMQALTANKLFEVEDMSVKTRDIYNKLLKKRSI